MFWKLAILFSDLFLDDAKFEFREDPMICSFCFFLDYLHCNDFENSLMSKLRRDNSKNSRRFCILDDLYPKNKGVP